MDDKIDYSNPYQRSELESWLHGYSDEEWQEYIDFAFSDDHKRDFNYDERNCICVVKKYLKIQELTTGQLKMVNWAKSIVERIENIKSMDNREEGESDNQPLRHFTFRVAWHDNMWNGTVCNDPKHNIFCNGYHSLLSDRIRREKEKQLKNEIKYAGKSVNKMVNNVGDTPPCFWSINIFGEHEIPVKHYNPAARHLKPIKENLPPYSMFSWPFALSFMHKSKERKLNGKYPRNLEDVRIPRFIDKVKNNSSIGFIYANFSNPISYEEMKYLIVGCGIIDNTGELHHFGPQCEIEKIKQKNRDLRNFPSVNWTIKFSFDPNSLVRIPYHEYMEEAKRLSLTKDESEILLSKLKVTIDEPELTHCFKYVAMDIDDDEAIFILSKIKARLVEAKSDGVVKVDWLQKEINKIEQMLALCWNKRTHFPGFRNLARALLSKHENDHCALDNFIDYIKESDPNYVDKIKELLNNPNSDKDYSTYRNSLLELKDELHVIGISVDEFLFLSMFNLSHEQFDRIRIGLNINRQLISVHDICQNPYLLFEEYVPKEDPQDSLTGEYTDFPIELFKIDIGLFPNRDYLDRIYLQENIFVNDKRRIRSLILQYLKALEYTTGDCFDDAESIHQYIINYPLFYKTSGDILNIPEQFLLKTDDDYDAHLSKKIEIIQAHNTKYYYLKDVYKAEKDVADFVQKLLNSTELNNLKYDNLDGYISKSIKLLNNKISDGFDEENFIDERTNLYQNIFKYKFYILCGNPGSGKSHEILNIVKYIIESGESYILLAPTGKATLRLKSDPDFNTINFNTMTIDKFVHMWRNKPDFRKKYNNIIIDEMSMVDLMKFNELLNFFEPSDPSLHRLILVGDPHQLPPIGFGKPFYDLIQFVKDNKEYNKNIIDLDVNCRQQLADNQILNFSKLFSNAGELNNDQIRKIEEGKDISAGFRIRYWENESKLIDVLTEEWQYIADKQQSNDSDNEKLNRLYKIDLSCSKPEDVKYEMENFQIITPYRQYSEIINHYFQTDVRNSEDIEIMELFKHTDKIIRTRNYYDKDDLILSNGSIGISLKLKNKEIVSFPELKEKYIPVEGENGLRKNDKDWFELAYSITVHKSQGSGFNHLIVVLPKKYALLSKELFYTALTRSKETISILIEGEPGQKFENSLFEYARKRSYTENRKTSLMLDEPSHYYGLEPEDKVFVQSRVEYIIYKHLMEYRDKNGDLSSFDFRYEKYPIVNDKEIRIKTDFTIYTKKGVYYWEHLGMLSKSSYKRIWMEWKLPTYKSNDLLDQLITTDELNGIKEEKIKKIIEDIIIGNIQNEDRYRIYSNHHYSLR